MGEKTYLKNQVYLLGLNSSDCFTPEEYAAYLKICEAKAELDKLDKEKGSSREEKQNWVKQKKESQKELDRMISEHKGPRTARLEALIYHDKKSKDPFPAGITEKNAKYSKVIAEFSSELTRAMGLEHMDFTFDHIVVNWRNEDLMKQIVTEGFMLPLLNQDGTVTNKYYHFLTSSAGQLRRDKLQLISDDMWQKIRERIECGLSWDVINNTGKCNVNKYLAYLALPASATEPWEDFDIDRAIVIPEFKGTITDRMMYIKHGYEYSNEICTVEIDHTDGCGMMLPRVSESNFMVRAPYVKGLLSTFDFIGFCREKNVPAVIKDIYGKEHDLIAENIQILFTESQFKMWKHYKDWDEYKRYFKSCGAQFCKTNYEEEEILDVTTNYQFTQTLTDFTDEEIAQYTYNEYQKILNITKNKDTMLETLKAKKESKNSFRAALAYYEELLWDEYIRKQLKDIRHKMIYDAMSGKIRMRNKRLYAIPDFYAACEFWFQHIEHPKGLLKKGEIACRVYQKYDKADVLRSPHLYQEHCVRNISHDPEVYRWFTTNGVHTAVDDLISRVLQFDRRSN